MSSFKEKVVSTKDGQKVLVRHKTEVTKESLTVISLEALCGQSRHTRKVTLGALDGKRFSSPSLDVLQESLDRHRQEIAEEASWKESVRLTAQNLV